MNNISLRIIKFGVRIRFIGPEHVYSVGGVFCEIDKYMVDRDWRTSVKYSNFSIRMTKRFGDVL